jgi:hypothetical protein
MSELTDYSKWQPIEHTGVTGDQRRDLDPPGSESYYAEIGPEGPDGDWSWTIMVGTAGEEIAGGFAATEEEVKQAVRAWDDQTRRTGSDER